MAASNKQQAKAKQKAQPPPGRAVVVGTPQAMRALPERMGELVAQKHFIEMVEDIYATLMVPGVDYGNPVDPRTKKPIFPKPMLYKPGAELLRLYLELQLKTTVDDSKTDYSIPLIRYRVTTDIYDKTGRFLGSGEGVCSSLETKYRYRWLYAKAIPASMKVGMTQPFKKTDPKTGQITDVEGIDMQAWIDANGAGSARWTQYGVQVRTESQDVFDQENTILSQAKKRSLADGIKTVTGASRIFLIGQEEIRAAVSIKEVEANGTEEQVEGEIVTEEPEQPPTKTELDIKAFHEELKSWMVKAGFTTAEGRLDTVRFKKLLQDTYKVENVGQLDEKGRAKLLSQMADFAAANEEGS